ncbi:hypothetical protein EV421DRAFT_1740717 [Armillaria borealis]|uniref:Uncharacterized protein n=1 Tax=Armillaria borealis TaxID=47425 RepID=A0AA39J3P2_9AGAR|nr:hypothetical protein EV421DRAFT_1740717 [Armillaria borealis]
MSPMAGANMRDNQSHAQLSGIGDIVLKANIIAAEKLSSPHSANIIAQLGEDEQEQSTGAESRAHSTLRGPRLTGCLAYGDPYRAQNVGYTILVVLALRTFGTYIHKLRSLSIWMLNPSEARLVPPLVTRFTPDFSKYWNWYNTCFVDSTLKLGIRSDFFNDCQADKFFKIFMQCLWTGNFRQIIFRTMVLHTIVPEIPDCDTYPCSSPTKNNGPSHPLHPSSNSTQGTYKFNYDVIPSLSSREGSEHQGVGCASSVPVANFDSGMTPCTSTTKYSIGEQCIFRPNCNENVFEHFFHQNHNSMLTQTLEANSSYGTSNTFEQPMNPTAWSYQFHMTQTYLHNADAFPSQPIASPIPSFPMFGENSYAIDAHDVAAVLPVSSYSGPSRRDTSYPTLNGGLSGTGSSVRKGGLLATLPVSSYSGPVPNDSSFPILNGSLPENQICSEANPDPPVLVLDWGFDIISLFKDSVFDCMHLFCTDSFALPFLTELQVWKLVEIWKRVQVSSRMTIEMGVNDHNGIGLAFFHGFEADLAPRRLSADKGVTERITVRDGLKETSGDGCKTSELDFSLRIMFPRARPGQCKDQAAEDGMAAYGGSKEMARDAPRWYILLLLYRKILL